VWDSGFRVQGSDCEALNLGCNGVARELGAHGSHEANLKV